ncbi:MAG: cysteine desulfurase family protein [Gammaproteobacteria bacterium]
MSIYLDHNATTPLDPRVWAAMVPYLRDYYANPSSVHTPGRMVRTAVDQAREQVAALVKVHPSQVIFTSGGTEANNLALKGIMARWPGQRLAVSAIEHASVLQPARALSERGWGLDVIGVDEQGRVSTASLRAALTPSTRLVSVMTANNEIGVVQDIAMLSDAVRRAGLIMHSDAVQAAGKLALDFPASGVHLMSLSAHKLYGPKGVGALIVEQGIELSPWQHGGGHEGGMRAGTENVAGIVGFGMAAELAQAESAARAAHCIELRRHFEQRLRQELPELTIVAEGAERLSNTVMILVPGVEGETLLMHLDQAGIAVSSGSACSAGHAAASHVLVALGLVGDTGRSAVRISFGRDNSLTDVDAVVAALSGMLKQFRAMSLTGWE